MSADQFVEATFRFVRSDGALSSTSLGKVDGAEVVRGKPVRPFPTYRGQRNYPGLLWTATTQSLVGYESLLERDRLWLADFDPDVRWIASQPFWVSGRDGSAIRRHVPDFMLESVGRIYTVVDVKPAALADEPAVAEVLAWTGRLCAAKCWRYEVWSGDDPVRLRNIRYLAAGRRASFVDQKAIVKVAAAGRPGMTLIQIESAAELDRAAARPAALSLLWFGTWTTDLTRPLSADSIISLSEAAA